MMFDNASARETELQLSPLSGIEPQQTSGEWIARTGRAEFEVHGLDRFKGQWVRLRFRLIADRDEWSWPRLSFDLGTGDFDACGIPLPGPTPSKPEVEVVFNVPSNLRSVRLRPIARPGRFNLGRATLSPIGKPRAVGHMLGTIASVDGMRRACSMLMRTIFPDDGIGGRWQARHRLVQRYLDARSAADKTYANWIRTFEANPIGLRQRPERQPLISIVLPVYNTRDSYLRAALDSVLNQTYANWQLCIADDCSTEPHVRPILDDYAKRDSRIQVVLRQHNGHISAASNTALSLATGEWVAFLDHDDTLHPHALHFVAETIAANPDASLIYTDEDKIDEYNERYSPYFKCDYNYELMLAQNMISHLGVYRRTLINEIGGCRKGFEGSQDYDLALRAIERIDTKQIVHLPRVLYHWRAHRQSTAVTADAKPYAAEAGRRAIAEHLQRIGVVGTVMPAPEAPSMNRVRYALPTAQPKVSIVICTRDRADLLASCVDSLIERSTYRNYEVLIVDNGSSEEATFQLFKRLPKDRFRLLRDESAFNFSALNNRAVRAADGDYICLLNNDIEVMTPDWMEEMLSFAIQPDVGAVGARLWYPGGGLQHAGVILGLIGIASHVHRTLRRGELGYFARAALHQSFSAVTGAALMIKKSIYEEVGGFDEKLQVLFNDIDFCLRVREAGYRNVWTPYAELIHHESATRGYDVLPHQTARAEQESQLMKQRWGDLLRNDPAYSLNLSNETEDLRLAWPPRIESVDQRAPLKKTDALALHA